MPPEFWGQELLESEYHVIVDRAKPFRAQQKVLSDDLYSEGSYSSAQEGSFPSWVIFIGRVTLFIRGDSGKTRTSEV